LNNGRMVYPSANTKTAAQQAASPGVYLFAGQDFSAKEAQLKKIKQEFLSQSLQDFNQDTLYAKEIKLKDIQEKFLCLPLKNAKRIIVIKEAQLLEESCREFLLAFAKKPSPQLVLVLDFAQYDHKDEFLKKISAFAQILRFKETVDPDTFTLNRQIELKKADQALQLLNQLLRNGEAPERILGGLRYAWERQGVQGLSAQKKLRLLLSCDLEIKTGRLKPAFALEKLIVSLCGMAG